MQDTAERLHSHLVWAREHLAQLIEEVEPIAFPKVPAPDVDVTDEVYVDGRWLSIVTRGEGSDGTVHFLLVGARLDVPPGELVIARPIR